MKDNLPGTTPDSPGMWPKPPSVLLASGAAAVLLETLLPIGKPIFSGGLYTILPGFLILLCGFGLAAITVRQMIFANTTYRLDRASKKLVTDGIFARSRNPIYLGFVIMLLGFTVMSGSVWALIMTVFFVLYLRFFVISREEAYLERRFGENYLAYKQSVCRWF